MNKVLKYLTLMSDHERPSKEDYFLARKYRAITVRVFGLAWLGMLVAIAHCAFAADIPGEKTITNPKHHDMTQEAAGHFKLLYTPPAGGKPVVLHFTCGLYDNYDANQIMQSHTRKVVEGSLVMHSDKPNRICYTDNVIPGKTQAGDRYVSGFPEVE